MRWLPGFGLKRELDWLKNMHDWLISKKRFWGLAIPIWECECGHFEVIGSKEELKKRAVSGWKSFEGHTPHRPWVDRVKIKCSKCGRNVSRIPDVGNPWLDAGIVTYSTLKYRTNKPYWKKWFPADLILECFPGQFKNWFYSLIAMSTVLEDREPTKLVYGHALVRDEKGEEMHKSKGNAIDFDEAAEKMGVDVMRWLYCSQNPALNLNFGYGPGDEVRRRFILLLWNVYNFFITYANVDGWEVKRELPGQPTKLDLWILTRLDETIITVTKNLDNYHNAAATTLIEEFVNDLSTWYLRRSRDRVGPTAVDQKDKDLTHAVMYTVLITLTKVLAPFTPYLSEEIYRNLKGAAKPSSVHLEDWPEVKNEKVLDKQLLEQMDLVRKICEYGHAARKEKGIKVRQPLGKVVVTSPKKISLSGELAQLIKDELNAKKVETVRKTTVGAEMEVSIDDKLTPGLKAEGEVRETVRQVQNLRKEAGCQLDEKVTVILPDLPKSQELLSYIKQRTLAKKLLVGKGPAVKRTR
jgi:isoleucyl-tRNA synthetase